MNKSFRYSSVILATAMLTGVALASDQWLHVRVEEHGRGAERVHLNIPLSVVEAMLPHLEIDDLDRGTLRVDPSDLDLDGLDLKEIVTAMSEGPDADYVTVNKDDEHVRVSKKGGYVVVVAEDRGCCGNERVNVRIPLAVVDALVGDGRGELDLLAGLRALSAFEGEELVKVESDDESIRIWIDSDEDGS